MIIGNVIQPSLPCFDGLHMIVDSVDVCCVSSRQNDGLFKGFTVEATLLLSRFSRVHLCVTHRRRPTRLPRPWDSPGKNTGGGCHFLLQCIKVKVKMLSHIRLLATPRTAAYQASPSMGFSRQEYWSGLPLPSPNKP